MNPPLSVITTVFNCENYVKESIQSILNQTFGDFELIVINDGSTDGTHAIMNNIKDHRLRYVYSPQNKKIPARRNQAIEMARGEFIAIHDGDDISLPERLHDQYYFIRNNCDYFCVGGHAEKIDLDGQIIGVMDYPPSNPDEVFNMVLKKCMNPMIDPTTMFRKRAFMELGKYTLEKDIYTVPDFDLWTRAMISGSKFINLEYPVIKYRVNPNGMTGQHKQEMIKAHMIVWRRFMSKYMASGLNRKENGRPS